MRRALELARAAIDAEELPIAAVLADGEKVLVESWNTVRSEKNLLGHAEFRALTQVMGKVSAKKLGARQRLSLYVTLEPCMMCFGMIMALNIGRLFFALESSGDGVMSIVDSWCRKSGQLPHYKPPETVPGLLRAESGALFKEFGERYPQSLFARWTRQLAAVTDV
jgi:tRNA(Arg) A34 adenosine deaminase TadA